MMPEDTRIVSTYAATEAIATSSGQNDSGMFELNFRDERYLPFEFSGAVSRWRIELPLENNQFDMETLSDVILHLNFTAREGGRTFAKPLTNVRSKICRGRAYVSSMSSANFRKHGMCLPVPCLIIRPLSN